MKLSAKLSEKGLYQPVSLRDGLSLRKFVPQRLDPEVKTVWRNNLVTVDAYAGNVHGLVSGPELDFVGFQAIPPDDVPQLSDEVPDDEIPGDRQIVDPNRITKVSLLAEVCDLIEHAPVNQGAKNWGKRRAK